MSEQKEEKNLENMETTAVRPIDTETREVGPVAGNSTDKIVRLTRSDDYEKRWIVVGESGALDFHCSHANTDLARRFGRTGGVEFHYRSPKSYMREDYGCTHEYCWILGGKCWHDGTSLWASEYWIPLLERQGEDAVWIELEHQYRRHEWPAKAEGR